MRTGYRTISIMCMPILNCGGDVIGVAQCINKVTGGHEFTRQDEEVFKRYLTFCGIGIQNAQLFEMSIQEYKRNQVSTRATRRARMRDRKIACLAVICFIENMNRCKKANSVSCVRLLYVTHLHASEQDAALLLAIFEARRASNVTHCLNSTSPLLWFPFGAPAFAFVSFSFCYSWHDRYLKRRLVWTF